MSKLDRNNFLKGVSVGLGIALILVCPPAILILGGIQDEIVKFSVQPPPSIVLSSIDRLRFTFGTITMIGICGLVATFVNEIKERKKRKGRPQRDADA